MSLAEQSPSKAVEAHRHPVAVLMEDVLTDLELLTLGAPTRSYDTFDYEPDAKSDYQDGRRFRYSSGVALNNFGVLSNLFLLGTGLLETERDRWDLVVQRRGDDMSPQMGAGAGSYSAEMRQYSKQDGSVQKALAVDFIENFDTDGPRLRYRDINGLTAAMIYIDSTEVLTSFPYRTLCEAAEELRREADALINLSFDLPIS